ncbi:VP2 [Bat sapovirus TLC58/HK]|uniref:VP2 n=2 Tax=unclassified Sapovirus TaxID=371833 RepID=I2APU6_9CALI|nr:VP2 [Bat sapovirus TLC58/HK]AFJ39351.1 VP2 [Bat sapovirus TLC34/HK]AFJ39354.1 VP2 [Bat sapovirus TLC39/HK]AFJ39356.1 VP2 [Bat sapovirus TLC58/HK]
MGSWTQGMIGLAGFTVDAITGLGALGVQAQNAETNRQLATLQAEALKQQLAANKLSMEQWEKINNPASMLSSATAAGFDPVAAMQIASRGTVSRWHGGVQLAPLSQVQVDGLRGTALARAGLQAGGTFTTGVRGPYRLQAGRPVYRRDSISSWAESTSTMSTRVRSPSVTSASSSGSSTSSLGPRPVVVIPGSTSATWVPGSEA